MTLASRIYRRLARAFPHEFKIVYGPELMQAGEEVAQEQNQKRDTAKLIRLIADITIRLPFEYLSEMRRDMRYAVRGLIKSPGFALVGILSTGIGIGLTTNVYSSKWQMITRELPAANAKRLVIAEKPVSYNYIERYRELDKVVAGVAAFQTGVPFNVTPGEGNQKPDRVFGQLVSPDYFSVLGVGAQRGRVLNQALDRPGDAPVVVISDRFWRNRLNSSPDAIGQTLRLNGQPVTIVGITSKDFNGALSLTSAELFVPITVPATLAPELANDVLHQRNAKEFLALMCLAPGVNLESAEAALDTVTRRLDKEDSSSPLRSDTGRRITLLLAGTAVPLPRDFKPVVIGFLVMLMGLIMTIACMNLANMLLARGANRRKELAIRLSIGASRFRLIRQLVAEGILLSLLGGAAGFAFAYGLAVLSSRFRPPIAIPEESALMPDWHAGLFVFALAIICGVGFSLVPALRATKADVTPALKEGSALQLAGHKRFGLRNLLMVAQIAGSLMLVLITGFLVMGISQLNDVQTRFDPRTMSLLSIDPVRDGYSPEKAPALFERIVQRLKAVGGVRAVALAAQVPFSEVDEDSTIKFTAETSGESSRVRASANEQIIGAGYFATLNEPLLAGREFTEADQKNQPDESKALPVMLNQSAVRELFGSQNAIGSRIRDDKQSYEVVGVVGELPNGTWVNHAFVYLPLTDRNLIRPPADGITILVRSEEGADMLGVLRSEIASIDPELTLVRARTLSSYLDQTRASQRFAISAYGEMGVFSLILAAIGLAGVTAYAVAQRRKEIGIRMALGARRSQVLGLILREGSALIGIGTVLGFLGAFGMARVFSAMTNLLVNAFRVGTNDPRLLVGAPLLLAALALLACYVPARKAIQIEPLRALREG
jgi:predicted permease